MTSVLEYAEAFPSCSFRLSSTSTYFFTNTVVTPKRMSSASEALQQYALSYPLPLFTDTHTNFSLSGSSAIIYRPLPTVNQASTLFDLWLDSDTWFTALYIYDCIISFSQETNVIWNRKWSMTTWIYGCTRYISLVYSILTMISVPTYEVSWRSSFIRDGTYLWYCRGMLSIRDYELWTRISIHSVAAPSCYTYLMCSSYYNLSASPVSAQV